MRAHAAAVVSEVDASILDDERVAAAIALPDTALSSDDIQAPETLYQSMVPDREHAARTVCDCLSVRSEPKVPDVKLHVLRMGLLNR